MKPWHDQNSEAWLAKTATPLDTPPRLEVWARGRLMATVWQRGDETPQAARHRAERYARAYGGEVV